MLLVLVMCVRAIVVVMGITVAAMGNVESKTVRVLGVIIFVGATGHATDSLVVVML